MIMRFRKNEKGQALVETAIVILVILVLIFGIMQLALIGTATIVAQDAAYFATRAQVVEKDPTMAAIYFMKCFRREDVLLASPSVSSETHSEFNEVVEGKITYFQQILGLFSWLVFNPFRTVTCKMVKSPDEGFYDKSFER
jgi:Flp pilus assembly pilin Flp